MSRLGSRPVVLDVRPPPRHRPSPIEGDSLSLASSSSSNFSETDTREKSASQVYDRTAGTSYERLRQRPDLQPPAAEVRRMSNDTENHVRSQRHRHRRRSESRQHSEERSMNDPSPRRRDNRSSSNILPTLASTRSMSHESRARHSRDSERTSRHRHRRHHSSHENAYPSYAEHERRKSRRGYSSDVFAQRIPSTSRTYDERPASSLQRSRTGSYRRSSWFQPIVELRPEPAPMSAAPLKRYNSTSTPQRIAPLARTQSMRSPSRIGDMEGGTVISSSRRSAPSGVFSGLFGRPPPRQPIKRVECVSCLSDDVPITRAARLNCGHVMCNQCLKRIFELSVTDPQHMPPKCCTAEHIPLKSVEKLFTTQFKVKWNRKYKEYTTRNRIYCPARGCGEWIKPSNIHTEQGRKIGRCQRCRTRVCCKCNGKWHRQATCPDDEETRRLVETATQEGWDLQRCYNCRALVQLKEGCNHMTCRCRAEFCMICGSKWKTCNCPWFNYANTSPNPGDRNPADILHHMVPVDEAPLAPDVHRPPPAPRAQPGPELTYQEELDARRRQEASDEALARRLQSMGIAPERINNNGRPGFGLDTRTARDIMTGPYTPQQAAADANAWDFWSRAAEGDNPRRSRSSRRRNNAAPIDVPDYGPGPGPEAEVITVESRDIPLQQTQRLPQIRNIENDFKLSEIAGVTRKRNQSRVGAWLNHVVDGAAA